jgi:hypothetical protein
MMNASPHYREGLELVGEDVKHHYHGRVTLKESIALQIPPRIELLGYSRWCFWEILDAP